MFVPSFQCVKRGTMSSPLAVANLPRAPAYDVCPDHETGEACGRTFHVSAAG